AHGLIQAAGGASRRATPSPAVRVRPKPFRISKNFLTRVFRLLTTRGYFSVRAHPHVAKGPVMKAFGALLLAALTVGLLAGSAQAASPAAVTGSVSNLSTNSVRLNGSVDPNSEATSWYFEFGQSTSYGTRTATQNAGSGANPTNVHSD